MKIHEFRQLLDDLSHIDDKFIAENTNGWNSAILAIKSQFEKMFTLDIGDKVIVIADDACGKQVFTIDTISTLTVDIDEEISFQIRNSTKVFDKTNSEVLPATEENINYCKSKGWEEVSPNSLY